jgi:hypothetical protein
VVGNFAPAAVADGAEASFAASGEGEPEYAALGFSASEPSPSGPYAEPHRFQATTVPRNEFSGPAAVRGDLLDSVTQELPYLPRVVDSGPARLARTLAAGIRRLVRADEPAEWKSLLDDRVFDPSRLDAFFAALG